MKKTLVALAVLAASGASFAQVTMTGYLETRFQGGNAGSIGVGTGADTSGLGVDGSELFFNASEDLGGGTKVAATIGIAGADRSHESGTAAGTYGLDSALVFSGSFGTVSLKTWRPGDYLSGGIAGVGGTGMDGKIFDDKSNRDSAGYSYPIGPVTLGVTYYEPANVLGEGNGTGGYVGTGQRKNSYSATYAAGAIAANLSYGTYDNYEGQAGTAAKNVIDVSGSYDLGVVKLGLGMERKTFNTGDRTDTFLAASVPVGALTIGANWAQRKFNGVAVGATIGANLAADATGNGTVSGYGLHAGYALSKRTSLHAEYAKWDKSATAGSSAASSYFLSAVHSF